MHPAFQFFKGPHSGRFPVYGVKRLLWILFMAFVALLGCMGRYFTDAGDPDPSASLSGFESTSSLEYWAGIVFNGRKIGFSHVAVAPAPGGDGQFEIRSEAALHFRFLAFDKKMVLKSYDLVASDLSLLRFVYDYNFDGNEMRLTGEVSAGRLDVTMQTKGRSTRQEIELSEKVHPTGAIALYPVIHGLSVGKTYVYQVYDGETQSMGRVSQEVLAYETSELYSGAAYRVRTELQNQAVTTWLDAGGRPLLEMSMGGVLIAALETERSAKAYLAQAGLNKAETMLEFSLIRTPFPETAGDVSDMEVVVRGLDEGFDLPSDETQSCRRYGEEVQCRVYRSENESLRPRLALPVDRAAFLKPSRTVPSLDPAIVQKAREIVGPAGDAGGQIPLLIRWLQENIEKTPVDSFSALDVLSGRRAECQGHTYLYTAFARSLGIPTRVANGIVYTRSYGGFLYHTWAESLVDGHWLPVDPTLDQLPADATHLKIVEGEVPSDLLPLLGVIGRIRLRVISAN
ncbi:MAG: transglutaminase domain-containing protein [Deltaproteobacteria bacterium]|nr:transglutaminase domain-containing protein [Deltaproteobacteria bacterium]